MVEAELRAVFEAQANDPTYKFKRSRRGTYVNPALARDWKWFLRGYEQRGISDGVFQAPWLLAVERAKVDGLSVFKHSCSGALDAVEYMASNMESKAPKTNTAPKGAVPCDLDTVQ